MVGGREMRQTGRGSAARWPNYPYAIKVIKAIIRRVKRLRENASSGRMGCCKQADTWLRPGKGQGTETGTGRRVKGTVRTVLLSLSLRLLLRAFQRKKELKFVETFTFFNLYEEQLKLLRRQGARMHAIIWTILVLNANICLNGIIVQ